MAKTSIFNKVVVMDFIKPKNTIYVILVGVAFILFGILFLQLYYIYREPINSNVTFTLVFISQGFKGLL